MVESNRSSCCSNRKTGKTQRLKGIAVKEDEEEREKMLEAKVVMLGDSGVGKSSISVRYCKNFFKTDHEVTIGGAYIQKIVTLPTGKQVKLHIWDTGGSERFRSMVSLYYRDAAAAIICYDITNDKSFTSVHYWINEMLNNNDRDDFVMALAGNKKDTQPELRKVTQGMVESLASQHNMVWKETSALSGDGIEELFVDVAERIVKSRQ